MATCSVHVNYVNTPHARVYHECSVDEIYKSVTPSPDVTCYLPLHLVYVVGLAIPAIWDLDTKRGHHID
jgi:hypothetical protein